MDNATASQPAPEPTPIVPPKSFFKKELASLPFIVQGRAVPFQICENNRGVIALDPRTDTPLITALNDAAANQRGGIVRIDEALYEDLKKKAVTRLPTLDQTRHGVLRQAKSPSQQATSRDLPAVEAVAATNAGIRSASIPQPIVPVAAPAAVADPTDTAPAAPTFKPTMGRPSQRASKAAPESIPAP